MTPATRARLQRLLEELKAIVQRDQSDADCVTAVEDFVDRYAALADEEGDDHALARFARHMDDCRQRPCTCGLDAARSSFSLV